MNGEGSDLSVPSPALAGYLGNTKNRGVVSGSCPWCSAKGQINLLRSYAINYKESITLCTGPLCLFPLVSRPLDNYCTVLSSQDTQGCKRKFCLTLETKNPDPSHKHWKNVDLDIVSDGKCRNVAVDDCRVSGKHKRLFIEEHHSQQKVENDKTTDASCGDLGDLGLPNDLHMRDPVSFREVPPLDFLQLVPTPQHLFWKSKDNLCWLDSLLVALVHSRVLRKTSCENVCFTEKFPCNNFTLKTLCATYEKSCTHIKAKEQQCQDKNVRVPYDDLRYVEQELEALRISAFQFLQPKLQCELGQKKTPAFALPLLLQSDNWANSLFQHTGQWEFRCTCCGYNFSTSMEKTVTTFAQIMADWHPLRAVHRTQCSNCHNKNQKRKLVLQRISFVLALHFEEGLPRKDLSKYAFYFNGKHYSIRTIIQYNEQCEHFITWIHQPDGLWVEFDDLKHPHCIAHKRFTLPARQFHLVFWEADYKEKYQLPDPIPNDTLTQKISKVDDVVQDITNSLPDDSCIMESLTENKDSNKTASTWDTSIGSTTLLDTFEGLSHSDIVTLTLVEVQAGAKEDACLNVQEMVKGPAKSSNEEPFPLLEDSSFYQTPSCVKNKNCANNGSHSPESLFPPVVNVSESLVPPKVSKCSPALHSSKPNVSKLSYLLHRHLSHQSTPLNVPLHATHPKVDLRFDGSETLLSKPAELFGGYRTKNLPNPVVKLASISQRPFSSPGGITTVGPESMLIKSADQNILKSSPSKEVLSTEALRLKLMKRLKAKKKKLARLNQQLSIEEFESTPRPDSTNISSPYSVLSSTSAYDSPAFDNFFDELLSPDINTSNPSPDSTGHLEILANSMSAVTESSTKLPVPLLNGPSSTNDNFLAKLNPGSREQQSIIDNAEFNALDIFF